MNERADGQDLYLLLEKEVRTPKERLLVDAFLPAAEAIPSALRRPAPPRPAPEPVPGAGIAAALAHDPATTGMIPEGPPAAAPRRRATRRAAEPDKSLEEEIAEFMSRSSGALAPDTDPDT